MEQQLQSLSVAKAFVVGLVIAAGYYFILYDPGTSRQNAINSAQQAVTEKQTQVQSMQETLEVAARYQAIAAQLGEEMTTLTKAAPEDYSITQLRKVLSEEAQAAGVSILRLEQMQGSGSTEAAQSFVPITAQVELEGTFNQLMFYLSNLTKVGKIIVTKEIEIKAKEPEKVLDASSPILTLQAVFEAYRYNPKAGKEDPNAQ